VLEVSTYCIASLPASAFLVKAATHEPTLTAINDGRHFGNRQRRPTMTAVKEHQQHTAKII